MANTDNIIAFDFGIKNIGVAVGHRKLCTARPLMALRAHYGAPYWNSIKELLKEWQPNVIIVGLPLNMDGSEQLMTTLARRFANCIYHFLGTPVHLHDERLSTIEARETLFKQGGARALQKNNIDAMSAALILESWLFTKNIELDV